MKAINYISKNERKLLLIFTFALIIFVLTVFTFDIIKVLNYNYSNNLFSGQTPTTFPLFHLVSILIFATLFRTKRFLLPFGLTVLYALVFIYGLSFRYKGAQLGGEEFSPKIDFHEQIFRAANEFDYIVALFISVLLFWQISILLRVIIKKLREKEILP